MLEGKYWKRRLDSVTAEYKKWRRFYMERALYALTNEDRLCMKEVCQFEVRNIYHSLFLVFCTRCASQGDYSVLVWNVDAIMWITGCSGTGIGELA